MLSNCTRRTAALLATATAVNLAAIVKHARAAEPDAEGLVNRLMHAEHITDKAELRAVGYAAAEEIKRLRAGRTVLATGDDAELLALGKQFDELYAQYQFVLERDRLRTERNEDLLVELREIGRNSGVSDATPEIVIGGEELKGHFDRIGKQLDDEFGPAIKPDSDDVLSLMDAPQRRIMALPAATPAGLAVKARVAWFGCEHYWDQPIDDLDWDQHMARALIDSVLDFCNATA